MKEVGLFESTNKLSFLGSGVPLFFDYNCFIMASLGSCFLIYGVYTMYKNATESYCSVVAETDELYCGAWWKTSTSAGNRNLSKTDPVERWLACLLLFFLLVLKICFFRVARKKDCDIDEKNTTPVDYTIMISGIPREMKESEVIDTFANYDLGENTKPVIEKINFAYYIADFVRLTKKKVSLEKKILLESKKEVKDQAKIDGYNKRISGISKELKKIQNTLDGKNGIKEKAKFFTGICFLTFKTQLDAEKVSENWKIGFFGVIAIKYVNFLRGCFTGTKERIRGRVVSVSEPPEPSDILWENLGTPFGIKIKRRLFTGFLTVILLLFSFAIILGLKYLQFEVVNSNQGSEVMKLGISLGITGFISAINALLKKVMRFISLSEKYSTMTGYHTGVLWKINLVIFQ